MNIVSRFKAYREKRRAISELSALDDRTLSDLGVARSHIPSAVSGR